MKGMHAFVRLGVFAVIFAALGFGYLFFSQESLRTSGRESADKLAQAFNDEDIAVVNEFVTQVASVRSAVGDADYILSLPAEQRQLNFISDEVKRIGDFDFYRAKYRPVGSAEDNPLFLTISYKRAGSAWEPFDLRLSID